MLMVYEAILIVVEANIKSFEAILIVVEANINGFEANIKSF